MNQRGKARVSGVCTVMCARCVFVCVSAVSGGSRSTIKDFNMATKSHKHRASLADTTGQMFISNQYEHKEITAVLSYVIYCSVAPANILLHCESHFVGSETSTSQSTDRASLGLVAEGQRGQSCGDEDEAVLSLMV